MGILEGKTMQGVKVRIPLSKIQHAVILGKSVVRIQELKNIKLRQIPFFETPMEAKTVKATKNSDFLISGSSYTNGFSTMGSTSITFLWMESIKSCVAFLVLMMWRGGRAGPISRFWQTVK